MLTSSAKYAELAHLSSHGAEVLQEVRLMKFEDVYSRRSANKLTQEQAAEILGVSCARRCFEADGAEGLYDRRLGNGHRVATDKVARTRSLAI
ncbi:hypothetical protein [Ruegeria sp.]|uniref:hypothetical protein n=1 Tax=Ruegeria sp. TaxID=1879320 RepID=UPI003B00D160